MMSERQKLLLKEELKLEKCGEFTMTREEEIEALKTLIHCIKVTENITDEECKEMFERDSGRNSNHTFLPHGYSASSCNVFFSLAF